MSKAKDMVMKVIKGTLTDLDKIDLVVIDGCIDIALKEQAKEIFDYIEKHYRLGYELERWKKLKQKYRNS